MSRPPLPPFTSETAAQKVRMAEDGWNSRDPARVALAYTADSRWRNRAEFLEGRDAIGGTWGVATSRLADWMPRTGFVPSGMQDTLKKIRAAHAKNGILLANYIHRYFEDMLSHLVAMLPLLKRGATVHYIVGNSIFYGHLVPVEDYLAQQMATVGLSKPGMAHGQPFD